MRMKEIWSKLICGISENNEDIATTPKVSRKPLWFNASTDGVDIFITRAKEKEPSSKISMERKLSNNEFLRIYPIYLKRELGESVSKEAAKATMNQTYWFAILKRFI
jgi:hypothetical protein